MGDDQPALLEVGRVTKPHGLSGEVLVSLTSTETSRLAPGAELHVGPRVLRVAASQLHLKRWIVRFDDVSTREQAEALQGAVLRGVAPTSDGDSPNPQDARDDQVDLWVHELIGAEVEDLDHQRWGTVVAVLDNPASDILELDSGDLVPLRFVVGGVHRQPERRLVRIDPPAGLRADDESTDR